MIDHELDGLVETRESVEARMREADEALARELGLTGPDVRAQIEARSREGKLVETRLAMDWYAAYASWRDWQDEEAAHDPEVP